jgi:hypothetical protein
MIADSRPSLRDHDYPQIDSPTDGARTPQDQFYKKVLSLDQIKKSQLMTGKNSLEDTLTPTN